MAASLSLISSGLSRKDIFFPTVLAQRRSLISLDRRLYSINRRWTSRAIIDPTLIAILRHNGLIIMKNRLLPHLILPNITRLQIPILMILPFIHRLVQAIPIVVVLSSRRGLATTIIIVSHKQVAVLLLFRLGVVRYL